jgi:3'-5' exoribonuclease-like protein
MRIFYDTEFLEDGRTIELISIGMVREDGAEYYAVSDAAAKRPLRRRIRKSEWLMANVVPSLPRAHGDARMHQPRRWLFNYSDPAVKPRHVIAREVRDFILAVPEPQLWAWYGAYDHVVLCQLWGRMIDLPKGVPMWTGDLKQEAVRQGNPDLPALPGVTEHNALSDAREARLRCEWLLARAAASR